MTISDDSALLTGDVSAFFKVSGEAVRKWERTGRLPALRTISGVRIFAGRDVLRLQAERATAAAAASSSR